MERRLPVGALVSFLALLVLASGLPGCAKPIEPASETDGVVTEIDGQLILTLAADGSRKVSGKGDKPIIDVTGDLIRRVFANRPTVNVEYTDRIVIS